MSLKDDIVGSCKICQGSGWVDGEACQCLLKFRTYNRLLNSGFSRSLIEYLDRPEYSIPQIDSGEEFIKFYLDNLELVETKGMSLFVYSQERGRGKTTLAHKVVFEAARIFVQKERYSSKRNYVFHHVKDLEKSFKEKREDWKATWYVLDDLGNEDRLTDWERGHFLSSLQQLLHYRRDKRLPTLITSNYRPSDLSGIYLGELDSLLEIHPSGNLGGALYRSIEVGGGEDLRLINENSVWPI
jgi:hypothetical protein